VNDRQTILDSFQPYYEVTSVSEESEEEKDEFKKSLRT